MIKIESKGICTGCYACVSICPNQCIRMKSDQEGFWYPEVDKTECINCGMCESVCPTSHEKTTPKSPTAYACYNIDAADRNKSSSGGIFPLIAELVLDSGGVVFGARFTDSLEVMHGYIETKDRLKELRGSKYVQSRIGNSYRQAQYYLRQGRKVLFSGTPCQIAGLRSYLQDSYDEGSLICVDFICHGVPSPKVWERYLSYREDFAKADAVEVSFRDKERGWRNYSLSVAFNDGTRYSQTSDKDMFMRAFLRNLCLRPCCYDCMFKSLGGQSDITLGDFWGIQNVLPELDDDLGTSLVIINTDNGRSCFDKMRRAMVLKEIDLLKAIACNQSAIRSARANKNRSAFFEDLDRLPFDVLAKSYCLDSLSTQIRKRLKVLPHFVLSLCRSLRINKLTGYERHANWKGVKKSDISNR